MQPRRLVVDARGLGVHGGRGIGRVIVELLRALTRLGVEADVVGPVSVREHIGPSLRWVCKPARHVNNILTPGDLDGDRILRLAHTLPGPLDDRSVACCYDLMPLKAPFQHYPWRTRLRRPLAWPAMRRSFDLYPRAHTVWTISQTTAVDAQRMLGIPSTRLVPIPLAAPGWATPTSAAQILEVRRRFRLPEVFVLWVLSGLNDNKNVDGMLRAVGATVELPPLIVAGNFARKSQAKFTKEARRAGAVHRSLGIVSDDDLRALLAAAACVAVPSRDEGYALPIAEALACGGLVVANDIPVLRELAHPRVIYADASDPRAFGAALLAATRMPRPRAPAPSRSWDDVAREVLELFS